MIAAAAAMWNLVALGVVVAFGYFVARVYWFRHLQKQHDWNQQTKV